MTIRGHPRILLATVGLAGLGVALGAGVASAGSSRPPKPTYLPSLAKPTQMELLGSNGKPIIGRNGTPIMVTVGGPIPAPSAPGVAAPPSGAAKSGVGQSVTVNVPKETDLQKARRIAPSQAP